MRSNNYYMTRGSFIGLFNHTSFYIKLKRQIKSLLYPFYSFKYNILILLHSKPKYNKKYDLTICAIFKNEGKFLKEWIEYYLMIGVEHFYLYNNISDDNFLEILEPYIKNDTVTLNDWPMIGAQCAAYMHWEKNYASETQWNTFIDIDEYICPKYDLTILDWIKKNDKYPVLQIYWKMFGSSAIMTHHEDKLLIEQYTLSWPKLSILGKCIYNTDYKISTFENNMIHLLSVTYMKITIPPINIDRKYIIRGINILAVKSDSIQINHYWSHALDIMKQKFSKGDAMSIKTWRNVMTSDEKLNIGLVKEGNCTSVDYTIWRFLLKLKIRMNIDE